MGAEGSEEKADVLQVLHPQGAVDQYIIEKHQHKPSKERPEDIIHQRLEGSRGIGEAKWHHHAPNVCEKPSCRCHQDASAPDGSQSASLAL